MRRFIVFLSLAASLGGIFVISATSASAHPVDPDGRPVQRTMVPASDPPPKVTVKVVRVQAPKPLPKVTVLAGDTLSGIGTRTHRTWQQLWGYNHVADPNMIYVGDVLTIPPASYVPPAVVLPAPAPSYTPPPAPSRTYTAPARTYTPPRPAPVVSSGYSPSSGFEACVIARESGGNSQVMGGSGGAYYGLYQFSYSTWVANGGAPGDWGHASASEQHQVFIRSSPSNWQPYDGC